MKIAFFATLTLFFVSANSRACVDLSGEYELDPVHDCVPQRGDTTDSRIILPESERPGFDEVGHDILTPSNFVFEQAGCETLTISSPTEVLTEIDLTADRITGDADSFGFQARNDRVVYGGFYAGIVWVMDSNRAKWKMTRLDSGDVRMTQVRKERSWNGFLGLIPIPDRYIDRFDCTLRRR